MDRFSLAGKIALVTGASRGIGQALALGLAEAGADLAVTARNLAGLQPVIQAIEALGRRVLPLEADVNDLEACRTAIEQAADRLGGLDILINNAGIEQVCPSLDVDAALWDRIVDTNLKGAFFCAQAAARLMRDRQKPGSIINLCSLTSEIGIPTAAAYGASKSGLLGVTRALAVEWAPLGIRVNALIPGYFRTDLTEIFYADEAWQARMAAKIPLGRFGALPDLQGAAIFLASNAAAYITGQAITIDGGILAAL